MSTAAPSSDLERRKQVRLRRRGDLAIVPQKYEGRSYFVVKDPVSLRYYRFKEQEHFLLMLMDGAHTLDEAQKQFEDQFRPERLRLEDLEQFGQQLLKMGLVQNETPQAGQLLYENRNKRVRQEWMQTLTNILYIKIPIFDPEKLLTQMLPYLWWMFTRLFLVASLAFMLSALTLVLIKFEIFYEKLPSYHEFFSFKTAVYLWLALGVVKIIHEFGHGLSCKAFGGEVHEMGFLFLCLSPAMYCNVSDAWRLPNKWHRIIISAAGIYVELMIAAAATFIWWNTPSQPFVNNLSLSLMVVCSVSTVLFNGNPLMRYDGYYVLADWLEIPNLRDRANKYIKNLAMEFCLGIEVPPEQYMEPWRRVMFFLFAVVSYVYRWVVTFIILKFLANFLKPYKLEVLSELLAVGALASMIGWPAWQMLKNLSKRGRLPDMKPIRVLVSACVVAALLFVVFFVPLPVTRIHTLGVVEVQPTERAQVSIEIPGILKTLHVKEGQFVTRGKVLAEFTSLEIENQKDEASAKIEIKKQLLRSLDEQISREQDEMQKSRLKEQRMQAQSDLKQADTLLKQARLQEDRLVLRAPREGVVIGLPRIDEVGKRWDREQNPLFCTIGDKTSLRVLVPVTAADFKLLQENLDKASEQNPLQATIRVQGHDTHRWEGRVGPMPKQDAREIPPPLSNKHGGPVATKPPTGNGQLVPQAQIFLVGIDIVIDPEKGDDSISIGSMAQVKIHCEYRSCAWWIWRAVSSTFDVGLWRP